MSGYCQANNTITSKEKPLVCFKAERKGGRWDQSWRRKRGWWRGCLRQLTTWRCWDWEAFATAEENIKVELLRVKKEMFFCIDGSISGTFPSHKRFLIVHKMLFRLLKCYSHLENMALLNVLFTESFFGEPKMVSLQKHYILRQHHNWNGTKSRTLLITSYYTSIMYTLTNKGSFLESLVLWRTVNIYVNIFPLHKRFFLVEKVTELSIRPITNQFQK